MAYENLKNWMDRFLKAGQTVGCGVEVYRDGYKDFKYVCGYSDAKNRVPLSGDELYNIYSCSKIATVTAAMQLLEKGYFVLSDPLYEYLPEYKYMTVQTEQGVRKAERPITVKDLFTMSAGFDYNQDFFEETKKQTNGSTREMLKPLAERPLCFEPGEKFQYSLCHDVLAALVSVISGQKFRDYVKENIFDPLDMTESYYHGSDEIYKAMAEQYTRVYDEDGSWHFENVGKTNTHIPTDEYDSGGAGIISSLDDYVKLLAALAALGEGVNGNRILSPAAVDLMRTPALTQAQAVTFDWKQYLGYSYGLGVRVMVDRMKGSSLSSSGEFGWCGAAGAVCIIDPKEKLAMFFTQHTLNPPEEIYFPRLRNALYA